MKVDLSQMTNKEQKEMARKFRQAPCIVCGGKQTGYRKIRIGDQTAFLPLCEKCQQADRETLLAAMEIADAATRPDLVQTR